MTSPKNQSVFRSQPGILNGSLDTDLPRCDEALWMLGHDFLLEGHWATLIADWD